MDTSAFDRRIAEFAERSEALKPKMDMATDKIIDGFGQHLSTWAKKVAADYAVSNHEVTNALQESNRLQECKQAVEAIVANMPQRAREILGAASCWPQKSTFRVDREYDDFRFSKQSLGKSPVAGSLASNVDRLKGELGSVLRKFRYIDEFDHSALDNKAPHLPSPLVEAISNYRQLCQEYLSLNREKHKVEVEKSKALAADRWNS
jgi:hypothetical protein